MPIDRENPFLDSDHLEFRQYVREFVQREAPVERVRAWDRAREFPYGLFDAVAQAGWHGFGIPEEYGGVGEDLLYPVIVTEEIARYSADLGGHYASGMWGAWNIKRWGTPEQKKHFLPDFVEGRRRFSFSITEPQAGSDAAALQTRAVADAEGWVVNGQKIFSTAADKRDNTIILVARTDDSGPKQHGISLFLVPNDVPGLTIAPMKLLARRILGTNQLFFDDLRLPSDALLGPLHEGWECMRWHLAIERALSGASYLGNAQGTVDKALEYAKQREQFGRPIGSFQAIGHMLADMQLKVDASRLMVYRVALLATEDEDCTREAAMAKLMASEVSFEVASMGMQILGGYAQDPDFDMERYFRDSKQSMVGAGTSQIQRTIIARSMGL